MTTRLDGRVAIVTGAGAGLGRAHALLLAQQGAKVVVNDLGGAVNGVGGDQSAADRVVAEINAAGGDAAANYDSVETPEGGAGIVDTALKRFGRLDILVNNAGILRDKSFAKMDLADFEKVLKVHLFGTAYCTKAAWPLMAEQKYGRVVVTTSVAGTSGNFGQANYAAAKLGLVGFMNALAIEGQKNNVLINAVSPGANTRMTEGLVGDTITAFMGPENVSPAVAWLSSEACNVTGTIITAAAGGFGRLHYFETAGVQFDPKQPITVEMFAQRFADIYGLDAVVPSTAGPAGYIDQRLKNAGFL